MRAALLVATLVACGPSDREQDCADVRAIVGQLHRGNESKIPRRYWSYAPEDKGSDTRLVDVSPYDQLKAKTWRTTEVREAVAAMVETGWTYYTPYSAEGDAATEKLQKLCGLPHATIVPESR